MDDDANAPLRRRIMVPKATNIAAEFSPIADENTTNKSQTELLTQKTSMPEELGGSRLSDGDDGDAFEETSLTEPLVRRSDDDSNDDVTVVEPTTPRHPLEQDEAWWQIAIQVFIPYMIAGFGMVAAGLVLDAVQVPPLNP